MGELRYDDDCQRERLRKQLLSSSLGMLRAKVWTAGPVGGDRRDGRMLGFVLTSMCDHSRVRTLTIPVKLSSAECAA